ncbi:ADORA2B [Branchiostoma lanceolatum]|uniref:ADORA2B protein n=1 Tax=Branchiostoma lanceolatum TaxID=7740 RepID=A0A8K0ACX8_BRALA|nr:ADORA2B [Branchiostoma lanceolatum]
MNDSMVVFSGLNSTTYETFWPCVRWHLENWMDYDLALAACSHLPDPFQVENRKIGIASAVVGAASLLMNGVVLCGIVRNHHLTEPMYMFVANLAVADCVAGLFSFFFCAIFYWEVMRPLTVLELLCLFFFVLVLSAVGVVLLSVDRYLAIFYPIFYKTRMSGRHVAVSLGIAWPVCAVVCLSPLMGWNCIDSETENCIRNAPVNYLVLINAILAVAVIVVVFVNVRIFIVLKQRFSRAVPLEQPQENLPAARRREQRVAAREQRQLKLSLKTAVTVVMIAAMLIIIWLPICVGFVRGILCHANEECATEARPYWGLLIAFCGSVVIPVIYAFRIKTIREALVRRTRRITNAVRERLG